MHPAQRSSSVGDLVDEIARRSRAPLEEASALPPAAYRSEALLEREIEQIFRREWICVGRTDQVSEPGDWFSAEVAGEPLLVVRGQDARVRVLSNVCRHRFARIAAGRGRASRFQCPYHAWTYDLAGQLCGAPFMDRARDFEPARIALPEVRSEDWQGFLYVNLDTAAPPLAPRLAPLSELLAKYHLERSRILVQEEEVWDANWKVVAENAMESYHIFQAHRTTLDPVFPTSRLEIRAGGDAYNLHVSPMREGTRFPGMGEGALRRNPDLPPELARALFLTTVYPSQVIVAAPETLVWFTTHPHGVSRTRVQWGVALNAALPAADTPEREAYLDALRRGVEAVNAEDRALVAGVQRGLESARAESGRLSHLERPIWEFTRYLARRLAPSS